METVDCKQITLVADSGSTKTDWIVAETRQTFHTQGINPVLMSEEGIVEILQRELIPQLDVLLPLMAEGCGLSVYFYGAGVRPNAVGVMQRAIGRAIGYQELVAGRKWGGTPVVNAASDLLGAARALCGHREGIACILGTGANSCLFDGEQIIANTPALGFILGDEGGGAALGKRFLNAIFKGLLPATMRDDYLATTGLTLNEVIRRVYREPMPNRFLASTSLYIGQHLDNEALRELVVENFRQFFTHNIGPYQRHDLPVGFVGSIAAHYEPLLREAAQAEGYTLGTILPSPIVSLCDYHQGRGGATPPSALG